MNNPPPDSDSASADRTNTVSMRDFRIFLGCDDRLPEDEEQEGEDDEEFKYAFMTLPESIKAALARR